jgi:hypothetical protein
VRALFYSYCLYKQKHNDAETLRGSVVMCLSFTGRVTHLSRCGFQCSLYGESVEFVQQ